jgi:branched-chain amino acid transport system ATP-binding protein
MTELSVRELEVRRGDALVLDRVSFDCAAGRVHVVLGSNGAGKSSMLSGLAGLLETRGSVVVAGQQLQGRDPGQRLAAGLALCPEGRHLFAGMSVRENLLLGAHLRRDDAVASDLAALVARVPGLAARVSTPAGRLSGGEQQWLCIARALMARPKVLMLDEPTLGLSPGASRELASWLVELAGQGLTVLCTEQNPMIATTVADELWVLGGGKLRGLPAEERSRAGWDSSLLSRYLLPGEE